MTIVTAYRAHKFDGLLGFSDSRISTDGPISEGTAKLLPVPLVVWNGSPLKGMKVVYRSSFALGFAGSTLTAYTVFAVAAAALQGLRLDVGGQLPTFLDLVKFIRRGTY